MSHKRQSLLDELAVIDDALLNGIATRKQEARGQQLVQLANAAEQLFEALQFIFNIVHDYESSMAKGYIPMAFKMARKALAAAKGDSK